MYGRVKSRNRQSSSDTYYNYKMLQGKKPGTCCNCNKVTAVGETIYWHPFTSKVYCNNCYTKWGMEVKNDETGSCMYDF